MTEFFTYYVGPDAKERCENVMRHLPEDHPVLESQILHVPDPRFPGAPAGAWALVTSAPVDLPGFQPAEASGAPTPSVPRTTEQLLDELRNLEGSL